jgi:predicted MFS family arabinose efflux permease
MGDRQRSASAPAADLGQGISRQLVILLAVASGAAVANLYYPQPLLHTLAGAFRVSNGLAGLLITVTQIGFVVGLALLVPLGDLLERRRLISTTLCVTAVAQAAATAAPSFAVFATAAALASITAVVAQVIVPMSSSLAAEHERGQVVGSVMSGLLIGILLARTASGLIAGLLGWRAVFAFAAAAMLALAAVLQRALPLVPPTEEMAYRDLLRSVLRLVRDEPVLRQRMTLGAAGFGCFSALWTALAFLLSGPPYHYGNIVIGLFGLAGVAGASAAPVAGRLADRGHARLATSLGLVVLLISWGVLALGKSSVIALVIGIVLLDLGVQGLHITNQSTIYALRPEARSRLTTAYMVSSFLGGALLSALTSALYSTGGWAGVCTVGAVTAALGIGFWALTTVRRRTDTRAQRGAAPDPALSNPPGSAD